MVKERIHENINAGIIINYKINNIVQMSRNINDLMKLNILKLI